MNSKERERLNFYCFNDGGLANRMQCLESTLLVAKQFGCEVGAFWVRNPQLHASYAELFQDVPGLQVIDSNLWKQIQSLISDKEQTLVLSTSDLKSMASDPESWASYDFGRYRNVFFRTWMRFCRSPDRQTSLVPIASLQERIDALSDRAVGRVGIHIRRTDNEWSKKFSSTEAFHHHMESMPESLFFAVSDDLTEVEALIARYPGRVTTSGLRNRERHSTEGIQEALIEMMLLSRTKVILGSAASTFGATAAHIGGIPLHIVR